MNRKERECKGGAYNSKPNTLKGKSPTFDLLKLPKPLLSTSLKY